MGLAANEEVRWDPASKRNYILNTCVPPPAPLAFPFNPPLNPPPPIPIPPRSIKQCYW